MLVHFMAIFNILRPFDIFYGHFVVICYIFPPFWYVLPKNLATLVLEKKEKETNKLRMCDKR
jgi:hypothetical protein